MVSAFRYQLPQLLRFDQRLASDPHDEAVLLCDNAEPAPGHTQLRCGFGDGEKAGHLASLSLLRGFFGRIGSRAPIRFDAIRLMRRHRLDEHTHAQAHDLRVREGFVRETRTSVTLRKHGLRSVQVPPSVSPADVHHE